MTVWTPELRSTLGSLLSQGYSASQIAAQFGHGLTRNAVVGKVYRDKELRDIGFARKPVPSAATYEGRDKSNRKRYGRLKKQHSSSSVFQFAAYKTKKLRVSAEPEFVAIPPTEYDASFRKLLLVDLGPRDCRYPVDGEKAETRFCGHPRFDRFPYCRTHAERCYDIVCVEEAA